MDTGSRKHAIGREESSWHAVSRDTVRPETVRLIDRAVIARLSQCKIQFQLKLIVADSGVVHFTGPNTRVICIRV